MENSYTKSDLSYREELALIGASLRFAPHWGADAEKINVTIYVCVIRSGKLSVSNITESV